MGKHDEKQKYFSWDPPRDEFYKNRIHTLEKANEELKKTVKHLEHEMARYELADEQSEHMKAGIIAEYEEEIRELKTEVARLKDAIVRVVVA